MRKIGYVAVLFALVNLLCSCEVNLITTTAEVPFWGIALPVLVVFVVVYGMMISKSYVCPHCHMEFKPKWYQFSICVHFMGKRLIKCPHCGRKDFCPPKK